jgi:cysteine-rich repeat protein
VGDINDASCGDGSVDTFFSETCDDTNSAVGDGCNASCQVEIGWICSEAGGPDSCSLDLGCGDGFVGLGEECDPGSDAIDISSPYSCSETCQLIPYCGNDTFQASLRDTEACDDENTVQVVRECTQAGGTWDAGTSTCTPPAASYNCFIGGFCSQAAINFNPVTFGYTNVYDGHTQTTEPALGAGCNVAPGPALWTDGISGITTVLSERGSSLTWALLGGEAHPSFTVYRPPSLTIFMCQ